MDPIKKKMPDLCLGDFCHSWTAEQYNIDNSLPQKYMANAVRVIDTLNDMQKCISPFVLTSGYRCPQVNKLVGGRSGSSHLEALAVDLIPFIINYNLYDVILLATQIWQYLVSKHVPFFQVLIENRHVHVDFTPSNLPNRDKLSIYGKFE